MSHTITRIFHPVGQGAFYSESHDVDGQKFNIVYDCGNYGNIAKVRHIAEDEFNGMNAEIDVLFISHFDTDHVSLIKDLKPYPARIRNVVLPLLNDEMKAALCGYYRSTADQRGRSGLRVALEILETPDKVFGQSRLIFVRSNEKRDIPHRPNDGRSIGVNSGENVLPYVRGTSASALSTADWMLRPFNYDWQVRSRQFVNLLHIWLSAVGGQMEDLYDPKFVINYRDDLRWIYKSEINKLCKRYTSCASCFQSVGKIAGDINENSLVVYSGPMESNSYEYVIDAAMGKVKVRPGCLYTGDYDLKQQSLNRVYAKYLNKVGTVQIPHHGAESSFCAANIPIRNRICPVSYGVGNGYDHPCDLVMDAIRNDHGTRIDVTDDPISLFCQQIRRA